MWNQLRNALFFFLGILVGSALNGILVDWGGRLFPIPGGDDTLDGLVAAAPLMKPVHFLFPWLGHALGTGGAAFAIVHWVQAPRPFFWGLSAGVVFLAGGIWMASMVPAPGWFLVADLGLAYLPMAWLGAQWGINRRGRTAYQRSSGEQ
jgi:hypothetical protein